MAYAYRHYLDGNGPYESEKFDTEDELHTAAAERRHNVAEVLSFDSAGNVASDNREVIDLDKSAAPADPVASPGDVQVHTDGNQPS